MMFSEMFSEMAVSRKTFLAQVQEGLATAGSIARRLGLVGLAIGLLVWSIGPAAAWSLTAIRLFDVNYRPCAADVGQGTVTSGGPARPANCFIVYGKAANPSGKPVVDADVFGRIYDADGNSILENRTRIGAIETIPPGTSEFEFRISVPANQREPLELTQIKASGFSARVR